MKSWIFCRLYYCNVGHSIYTKEDRRYRWNEMRFEKVERVCIRSCPPHRDTFSFVSGSRMIIYFLRKLILPLIIAEETRRREYVHLFSSFRSCNGLIYDSTTLHFAETLQPQKPTRYGQYAVCYFLFHFSIVHADWLLQLNVFFIASWKTRKFCTFPTTIPFLLNRGKCLSCDRIIFSLTFRTN